MKDWIKALLKKYECGKSHPKRVCSYSEKFFSMTNGLLHNFSQKELEYLQVGAYLHDIGYFISSKEHHKNSYNLIMNENLEGFNSEQKKIIANIARYHRGTMPKDNHKNFVMLEDRQKDLVKKLGGIVKLSDGFDGCPFAQSCELDVEFNEPDRILCFKILSDGAYSFADLKPVLRKKDLFEEGFDVQLLFVFSRGC